MLLNELFETNPLSDNIHHLLENESGVKKKSSPKEIRAKQKEYAKKVARYLNANPSELDTVKKIFRVDNNFGENKINESLLIEGRDDINDFILSFQDIELLDESVLSNIKSVGKGVGKVAKGAVKTSKVAGSATKDAIELGKKLTAKVKAGWEKMEDTAPAKNANAAVANALSEYAAKLGEDHKTVKIARSLGEIGKNHPKKSAFVIGALSGMTSFIGTPAGGIAVGIALRTAMGLAKGEKLTTAAGKSIGQGAFSVVGGEVIGGIVDGLASAKMGLADLIVDTSFTPQGKEVTLMDFKLGGGPNGSVDAQILIPNNRVEMMNDLVRNVKKGGDPTNLLSMMDEYWGIQDRLMGMSTADEEKLAKIKNSYNIVKKIGSMVAHAGGAGAIAAKNEKGATKTKDENGKEPKKLKYTDDIRQKTNYAISKTLSRLRPDTKRTIWGYVSPLLK